MILMGPISVVTGIVHFIAGRDALSPCSIEEPIEFFST